jgi:hypothetical protein
MWAPTRSFIMSGDIHRTRRAPVGQVRIIIQGTIRDYGEFSDINARAAEAVRHEVGTTWECFADEVTGRAMYVESYADEETFVSHFQSLMESGLGGDLMKVYEIERMTMLTPTDDPRVNGIMQEFNAIVMRRVEAVGTS